MLVKAEIQEPTGAVVESPLMLEDEAALPEGSVLAAPAPGSPRLRAASEVILCSGFPTQLLLVAAFGLLGIGAVDASGGLSLRWVVMLSLADAMLLLGLVFYFLHRSGDHPTHVFLGSRPPRREFVLGLILTPVMVGLAIASISLLHYVWPGIRNVPENPFEALLQSPADAATFAVVAVVAGGLREELQRAFILVRFEQHLGGAWLGLLVFSIAFGLGHVVQGWDAAVVTALLGALWGTIYLIRRSVLSTIASHAGFNIAEIILAVAGVGSGTG